MRVLKTQATCDACGGPRRLLRDEVLRAGSAAEQFARLGPRSASAPCAPETLEKQAAELEDMARIVARWPASA